MANEEHVAILRKFPGAVAWNQSAWNQWRGNNPKVLPDLAGANLKGALLLGAGPKSCVNLKGADLNGATLTGATLRDADLEGADLRGALGLKLDYCRIKDAKFSPGALFVFRDWYVGWHRRWFSPPMLRHLFFELFRPVATDPWSTLRRKYTGPNMVFTLIFLLAFVVPYLAKTMMWIGVNRSQDAIVHVTKTAAEKIEASQDPNTENLLKITAAQLAEITPCLADECEDYRVWQVVLGTDKGPRFWVLALLLIFYNLCRFGLTRRVAMLRDEEERCWYSPEWSQYSLLYRVHFWVARVLWWAAAIAIGWHGWEWLFNTTVWLPATQAVLPFNCGNAGRASVPGQAGERRPGGERARRDGDVHARRRGRAFATGQCLARSQRPR